VPDISPLKASDEANKEPLVGSISVSPDNNELYAVTRKDGSKLINDGDMTPEKAGALNALTKYG
jgi:hypothetical protein